MGQVTVEVLRPSEAGPTMVSASVEHGAWSCADARFLGVLNSLKLPLGYHPDEDLELAHRVVQLYGGSISDSRNLLVSNVGNKVY